MAHSPLPAEVSREQWAELTARLLDSYRRWTGSDLIPRHSPDQDLLDLWEAPRVVVAHGTQSDPQMIYGNLTALKLWEMQPNEFLGMPSRLTAEPVHRDERQRLLDRTRQFGFVDDYRGIRISKSGKRFVIEQAILWMVVDGDGNTIGQAATFDRWTPLT